jgi:cysteinyl-tRNA synthetase
MQVYNTMERAVVPFAPTDGAPVTIYVCGPTVQSEPHLGHGRSAVAFDVLWRYLEWAGHDVVFVRNVTDIEDKIILRAIETGKTTEEVAAAAYRDFTLAYDHLGNRRPTEEPKATDHIPEMIDLISTLIDHEVAYASEGDVYFSVRSFDGYGKLSRHNLDDLRAGDRIEPGTKKHEPLDFALWKAAKAGEPAWDSPWGAGRPGWHVECSAMAERYLGRAFDIHCGGTDLIFPHHENEIAQSEASSGSTFARYWMHNGMLNLRGQKMAKSTGHLVTLLGSLERWDPMALRLFFLRTHYRKPLDYTEDAVADADASLGRLRAFLRRTREEDAEVPAVPDAAILDAFRAHMDLDLDVAGALAVVFDAVRDGNSKLDAGEPVGGVAAAVEELLGVLGLDLGVQEAISDVDIAKLAIQLGLDALSVEDLLAIRLTARQARDFALADAIRDGLAEQDITIEDSPDGSRWHRN